MAEEMHYLMVLSYSDLMSSVGENELLMDTSPNKLWMQIDERMRSWDTPWTYQDLDQRLYTLSWKAWLDPEALTPHPWDEEEFWCLWDRWDQVQDTMYQDYQWYGDPHWLRDCIYPELIVSAIMSELLGGADPYLVEGQDFDDVRLAPYAAWRARLYGGGFMKAS